MKLRDLPVGALFRFVPGPSPTHPSIQLTLTLMIVPPQTDDWNDRYAYEAAHKIPGTLGYAWSARRDGVFGACEVKDVDLMYADTNDPLYSSCAWEVARLVGERSREPKMVSYPKDPTPILGIIAVGREAHCTTPDCVKLGTTVELGASGLCYCCGKPLKRGEGPPRVTISIG